MLDTSNVLTIILLITFKGETLPTVKREFNLILEDSELHNIPILFIGNKIDLQNHLNKNQIIQGLN